MDLAPSITDALQVAIFGLIVVARMNITSHLARKRVLGFIYSAIGGLGFVVLMGMQELWLMVAMNVVLLGTDVRGIRNNLKKGDKANGTN